MGKIMKDGISYSGSTYTGGTDIEITGANVINAKVRELTQAQYDALSSAEKNNGTTYYITDGIPSVIGVTDVKANGTSIVSNHVANIPLISSAVTFDNTGTGLSASNVQAVIEELNECKIYYKVVSGTTNNYGFIDVGVTANQYTLISAIKLSSNDNGEMAIPYRNTNASNSPQSLFVYNNNFVARANIAVTFLVFFAKKVTEIS